jgi:PmbA protein
MSRLPREAVEQALAAARPGEIVEAALEISTTTTVTVADGELESSEDRRDQGLGIRLFGGGRIGFAASSDLGEAAVAEAVERARDLAACARQEDENRPAPAGDSAGGGTEADPEPVPPAPLVEPALALEAAARGQENRLRTRAASITAGSGRWIVAHSAGMWRSWSWQRAWSSLEVVALCDGVRQTGWESSWGTAWTDLDVESTGRAAADRAMSKFNARRPATARTAVVLSPTVTAGLFETLAGALSGKAVVRGRSLFAENVGQTIASRAVTLTDHGQRPDGFAAAPFDGEGQPSRPAVLIQNGILEGFLHNTYTALKLGAAPTGHGVRDEFSSLPHVGIRNLLLEPSGPGRQEILGMVTHGVLVEEVMGLHTIDPVSGDFSLGASGRALEKGQPAGALEGFTVAGNIREILAAVQAVGDDVRFLPGGAGGSTVLLDGLTISGT